MKGFENLTSPVTYLAATLGQYLLYRAVLEITGDATPLYLALPAIAYNELLLDDLGQLLIKQHQMKLIVFDPFREEVVQWIQ